MGKCCQRKELWICKEHC